MHYVGQYLEALKVFSLRLYTRGVKPSIIIKNFPARIFPQPQECGARLVTVTKKSVPRSSATSFAFSQAKHFFLFN